MWSALAQDCAHDGNALVHHPLSNAEIAIDPRADIGIRCDRRGALELAIFLRQLVRGRDEDAGNLFADQGLDALLMRRVAIGMEQQDRDGFDALVRTQIGDEWADRRSRVGCDQFIKPFAAAANDDEVMVLARQPPGESRADA